MEWLAPVLTPRLPLGIRMCACMEGVEAFYSGVSSLLNRKMAPLPLCMLVRTCKGEAYGCPQFWGFLGQGSSYLIMGPMCELHPGSDSGSQLGGRSAHP